MWQLCEVEKQVKGRHRSVITICLEMKRRLQRLPFLYVKCQSADISQAHPSVLKHTEQQYSSIIFWVKPGSEI